MSQNLGQHGILLDLLYKLKGVVLFVVNVVRFLILKCHAIMLINILMIST
jgi:hypothetical protein